MRFRFEAIGHIESPYTDKFGIPRQPGLARSAEARLVLAPPFAREEAFKGIQGFSHVWLIFVFHDDCLETGWRPTVRPPRLGGRGRVGVFASRAPYRPNPLGISAVEHLGLERDADRLCLRLRGADLLDGTPVLDVKPYVPYADAIADASGGFAVAPPAEAMEVSLSAEAERAVAAADPDGARQLRSLIVEVISQDPRPGYMDRYPDRDRFVLRLYDLDIQWRIVEGEALVTAVGEAPRTNTRPPRRRR
jgi:tRNA-Thr(GGU) m(6)t(6)A37 methyltransferase TsaA